MQNYFTEPQNIAMEKLEREILDWIAAATGDEALKIQLADAEVVRRDYTRTGYFTYFTVPDGTPVVPGAIRPSCPRIVSDQLPDGAGTGLFFQNGRVHYLEIYARGGFFPEELINFQLVKES